MCFSVVAGVVGALVSASSAASAAKAQAAASEQNARLAEFQSEDAIARGADNALRMRRQFSMLQGRQRASAAASGIDPDSGSMLDIQKASAKEGEYDIAANSQNAAREAWGYEVQAVNYRNQASAANASARNAWVSGGVGAVGSLLSLATPSAAAGSNSIRLGDYATRAPFRYDYPIGPNVRGKFH
jgi:hypothetical protein